MTDYNEGSDTPLEHTTSKYDGFTLIKTEHDYRSQKGSGREAVFGVAKDGMKVGEWAKLCATKGASNKKHYRSQFTVGSLIKLQGAKNPGWKISEKDDQGRTFDDVKKIREVDPKKAAERSAKAAAAKATKANKQARKTSKKKKAA